MYTIRRRLVGVLAVLAALGSNAHGQAAPEIRGTVRDSGFGVPLSGAIVQLLDSTNRVLTRTLSDQNGQYRLTASFSAARLQALRIGFHPRNIALRAGETTIDVAMSRLPQRLEPVVVTSSNSCPRRRDAGEAYALWDEARTGLLATVVAREARHAAMQLIEFTREMNGDDIDRQNVRLHDKASNISFVAVQGAPAFARLGFMSEDSTGARVFYGPDADVLLDPQFAATHCFSIAKADKNHPGESGLAFEPVEGGARDSLVEVRGTLWVDRAKAALRSLEYRYTNLEPIAERIGAGGLDSFLSLANGVTLIDHWDIRFPLLKRVLVFGQQPARRNDRNALLLQEYDAGGQLVSAAWPDSTSWHAKLPMIVGVVVDTGGRPMPGVTVTADSTDYQAVSDTNGGFVIHDVLPGPYRWFASVRDLTALGVRIGPAVDMNIAAEDYSARVKLVANRGQAARDFFCGGKQEPGSAAVLGQLLYADHSPGGNLDIRVAWGDDQANHWIDVRTNAVGRFKMCSVPLPGSPRLGGAPAARIQVFKGGNRLLSDIFAFPTNEWIQGVTITLPVATP